MTRYHFSLLTAFVLSMLLHAGGVITYEHRGWLTDRLPFSGFAGQAKAAVAQSDPIDITTITFIETPKPFVPRFMETYDHQPEAATPPDAPFYGTKSTVAANPDNPTDKTGELPYLDGSETRILNAETVPLQSLGGPPPSPKPPATETEPAPITEKEPAPPAAPEPPPPEQPQEVEPTAPVDPEVTRLAMVKERAASPLAKPTSPTPGPGAARPGGDFATAKAHQTAFGVDRRGHSSFDVMATDFADYDREMFKAIQKNWFKLVDKTPYWRPGLVRLSFGLYEDGRIGTVRQVRQTAGEVQAAWCEKAVTDASPFGEMPDGLRDLLKGQPRDITITFYY